MNKLAYCIECKRVFSSSNECIYCKSQSVKELARKSPVNVIGTKLKGSVLKTEEGVVQILFKGEKNSKSIKEFDVSKIRKIL